ncbi:hypothetical protein AVEN_108593-1 [Araneus ventricosus]|uniref:Uncharacterized protein n=1 Tax=Araneus ventricosus TaxID=182803 RepID=A0A4Y2DIZ2_ARAVE|nr:hypothetical protein AVEN_108593-1 [Araneus ventricosus]
METKTALAQWRKWIDRILNDVSKEPLLVYAKFQFASAYHYKAAVQRALLFDRYAYQTGNGNVKNRKALHMSLGQIDQTFPLPDYSPSSGSVTLPSFSIHMVIYLSRMTFLCTFMS